MCLFSLLFNIKKKRYKQEDEWATGSEKIEPWTVEDSCPWDDSTDNWSDNGFNNDSWDRESLKDENSYMESPQIDNHYDNLYDDNMVVDSPANTTSEFLNKALLYELSILHTHNRIKMHDD